MLEPTIPSDIAELLDSEARRICHPDFIAEDPVQFPRRFDDPRDIEIAALLCSTIAWGNRRMICRDCERMLSLMEGQPLRYVMERGYEDLPDMNIHRTFFAANLRHYLRGLRDIYARFGSLEAYVAAEIPAGAPGAPWEIAGAINRALARANNGTEDSRCLPLNLTTTALKRLNMALRWLVRTDGIVDLGIWKTVTPAQLYIPLDVHVGNTARDLGIITRKSNDRRTVEQLTAALRTLRPDDPAWYDYALFGIGVGAPHASSPEETSHFMKTK